MNETQFNECTNNSTAGTPHSSTGLSTTYLGQPCNQMYGYWPELLQERWNGSFVYRWWRCPNPNPSPAPPFSKDPFIFNINCDVPKN